MWSNYVILDLQVRRKSRRSTKEWEHINGWLLKSSETKIKLMKKQMFTALELSSGSLSLKEFLMLGFHKTRLLGWSAMIRTTTLTTLKKAANF